MSSTAPAQCRSKVLIIGLDGATFGLLDRLMADGLMPFLRETIQNGASGPLTSAYPPVTAAAFASFLTGMNPGKHGIYEFLCRRRGDWEQTPVNSTMLRAKTVWTCLGEAGLRVGVLSVPLTYPPQPINGFSLADFLTPKGSTDLSHPPELITEIEESFGPYPLYHSKVYTPSGVRELLDECHAILDYRVKTALHLMHSRDWDVLMIYLEGTDRVQHELWHILDETHPRHDPAEARRYRQDILGFYQETDAQARHFVQAAGPGTNVILMSDHGFGPIHHFVNLNIWLWQQGFLALKGDALTRIKALLFQLGLTPALGYRIGMRLGFANLRLSRGMSRRLGLLHAVGRMFLSLDNVDWEQTQAYSQGNYGQIYVNLQGREPSGIVAPGVEYEGVVSQIVAALRELRDPATHQPIVERVFRREDLYQGPLAEESPDVMFLLEDTYKPLGTLEFSSSHLVEDAFGNSGDHRMDGILVMTGDAIRQGLEVQGAKLIDLAPTILYLAGVAVPSDMDGRVLAEAIEPAYLEAHPAQRGTAGELQEHPELDYTAEERTELMERLRRLGYVG
jgi:predicted AlkP superfamily phosphohydrolase/phosphomutase